MKGKYKRPLTSRYFIGLWKEKRYRRNMMFLFAGHSAGLLNNNHVQLKLPWLLESQLHGSQRKSYLSVPFFFHLRCEWLVRGRLYLPNQHHESHHKICNLRYGTLGVSSLGSAARNLDWRIFTTGILHAAQPWINKKLNWFVFRILGAAGP